MTITKRQARLAAKQMLFRGGRRPRKVKAGVTAGVSMLLDRRYDVQRELGMYEIETRSAIRRLLKPGSVALDIGCGDGYESLGWAKLGSTVYAYDPDPTVIERFRSNLALNPDVASRITVYQKPFPGDVPVPAADFAKVDVDGGEFDVIALLTDVPKLLVEVHSIELESACSDFLRRHGYTVAIIPNARWRILYPEWRPIVHNRWLTAMR